MNNGIFDFKKKIAFTAALVIIANSFGTLPASAAVSSIGTLKSDSVDLSDDSDGKKKEVAQVEKTDAVTTSTSTATTTTTTTTSTTTTSTTTTSTTTTSTTSTTTTTTQQNTKTYTVVVNGGIPEADFYVMAKRMFAKSTPVCEYNGTNGGTITVNSGEVPSAEKVSIEKTEYRRKSASGNSLEYDAYYKAEVAADVVNVTISGIPEDGFCKYGSEITVKPNDEYTLIESDEARIVTVERPISFKSENIGNDEYRLSFGGASYIISPRFFSITISGNYKVFRGDKETGERRFKWKEINDLRIEAKDKQALSIYDGSKSKDFKVENDFFKMSDLLTFEQFRYSNNAQFVVTGVNWNVCVKSTFDGASDRETTRYFHVEKGNDGTYFFRVPYLELGNYYLDGYEYFGHHDVDLGKMYSDISGENAVGYCKIPYFPGENEIELKYKKFTKFGSYTFAPSQDISLRSGSCFSIDSDTPIKTLMTLPASFDSSVISYDYFKGNDVSGLHSSKFSIDADEREFKLTSKVIKDPVFILVKNIIKDADGLSSGIDDSICFYNDKNAPTVSDTEEHDENKWYGKEGAVFTLDIHDREECPIPENDTVFYEEKEIRDVYEKFINAPTVNKQEIASVIVGDYRFDRPEGGWSDAITGYLENAAVRSAEKELVELLSTIDLSEVNASKYSDQGDSYNYYKKIIRNGVCDELKKYYSAKLTELSKNEDAADEAAEIAVAAAKLENHVSAYEKALAGAKNTHKTVPSLTFDTQSQTFKVTLKPADEYKNTLIQDSVDVYAVDNSGNSGIGTEKMYTINVRMDCAPPVISAESLEVINAVPIAVADGEMNYVVKEGTIINAAVNDIYGDSEGSGVKGAEWYVGDDSGSAKRMLRNDDGKSFGMMIDKHDIEGKNLKSSFSIKAADNVDNSAVLSSDTGDKKINLIFDTERPLSSITDASDVSKVHTQEIRDGENTVIKKWYGSYEDIKLNLYAADVNPDKCSGIYRIFVEVNGVSYPLLISENNIDIKLLKEGKYYISFEKGEEQDSFDVYLKCAADSKYKVQICSGIHRLGREEDGRYNNSPESGSIRVKFFVRDNADLESEVSEERVYIDLDAPTVAGADTNGTDILRRDRAFRFEAFSDGEAVIRVRVDDRSPSSGISEVKAHLFDKDGNPVGDAVSARRSGDAWELRVPVNFKGFAKITAWDNVGKSSLIAETLGIVTENSDKHSEEDHVSIVLPPTSHKDKNGLPLYNSDVHAQLTVRDSFSGIADVFTSVSGEAETRLGINRNGDPEDTDADAWNINRDKSENNLVTEVTRDMVISGNSNGSSISLRMNDRAGNPNYDDTAWETFSIDTVKPVIRVAFADGNNSSDSEYKNIFKSGRKAVITVTERNFDPSLAEVMLNGQRLQSTWTLSGGTEGTDTAQYSAEVSVENDGKYKLTVNCRDMGDLKADPYESGEFIIDGTAPVLNVSFDKGAENQHYFNSNVTATLRIKEENFDPNRIKITGTYDNRTSDFPKASEWAKVGSDYVSTIKFEQNGDYELSISGRDKAGNSFDTYSGSFCVDTKKPTVSFDSISRSNNSKEIRPSIRFDDPNIKKETIKVELEGANRGKVTNIRGELTEKNGGYEYVFDNIPNKPEYDDIYTIKATAEDNASNKIEKKFRFSVNRFGSTFTLAKDTAELNGGYISSPKDIIITEYNADKHAKQDTVLITKDSEMLELREGIDYTVEVKGGVDEWTRYIYNIFSRNFDSDARYTVSIHSYDEAGNVNISDSDKKNAEVSFCVDKTKPLCIPINIADNRTYKGESYTARLSVSDNIVLKNIRVYVDGVSVNTRLNDDECSFNISNSSSAREVCVVLTDMAGNEEEYHYKNILVTTNIFRLLFRKTWFKITGGVLLLLAGASAVFIRKRKKRLL
ncbi:hypothetical protein SAMN02910265_02716 [Ruminococcus flavefaciens]|uniref:Ig-like domain (Group 3) n=1 Tax=Ruminococcus flavefaciens TaxID=1265 RepID=A0A1H6L4Q8_RUMFL|nr:hypothetical protein [Ruminococcus flavefaciens]SEH79133.1 hypothetical protein SAMN02910265_02716 [Ruminococcus flavefaciens]